MNTIPNCRIFCLALALCPAALSAAVRIAGPYGDNMVLQRDSAFTLRGQAAPGEKVTVTTSWGETATAQADAEENWSVKLKTGHATKPQSIAIAGAGNNVALTNLLFGEVWLCSGQSNMEWALGRRPVKDATNEIAAASHPQLRLFHVPKRRMDEPATSCEGTWEVCSPASVTNFSAVGYFFGRELQQELKVPVGLIDASWGGTEIELWLSANAMTTVPELAEHADLERAKAYDDARRASYTARMEAVDPGWNGKWDAGLPANATPITNGAPGDLASLGLGAFDGVVWFEASFEAPTNWVGRQATLDLGGIDEADMTWVNGKKIGETMQAGAKRKYRIPAGLLQAGRNVVVIRLLDKSGRGGFVAPPEAFEVVGPGARKPLEGWRWIKTAEFAALPAPLKARQGHKLYNGMIAPLLPLSVRGAIWYQGESNIMRARQYRDSFRLLIESWRQDFGRTAAAFPFLFVQIAPFSGYATWPGAHSAARLREAQLETVRKVPNTGMVVVTDLTDNPADIHPQNKQDVGLRLARLALAKTYGRNLGEVSGPLYRAMKIEDGQVRIQFDHATDGLVQKDGDLREFTLAGADGDFLPARAKIEKDEVVVWSEEIAKPVAVRFAWSDAPNPNLFNKAGLPASPFRTDERPDPTDDERW